MAALATESPLLLQGKHRSRRRGGRRPNFAGAEKGTQLIFTARLLCYHFPMPRRPRICPGGTCFQVINRAVARLTLFEKEADYIAFERVLEEARNKVALPIFAYIVMPNHWHFVVKPKNKNQVTDSFGG